MAAIDKFKGGIIMSLIGYISQNLTTYLKGDFAQGKIQKATDQPGQLTRLLDGFLVDLEIGKQTLDNARTAAQEGNLENYLSEFAQKTAKLLLNDDLSDLHPDVIEAIGDENYKKIKSDKPDEMVKQILESTIVLHTQIISKAFEVELGITSDMISDGHTEMDEGQREKVIQFSEKLAQPSERFALSLTPDTLYIDHSANEDNPEESKKAIQKLESLNEKLIEADDLLASHIAALKKWGRLKEKSVKNSQENSIKEDISSLEAIRAQLSRIQGQVETTLAKPNTATKFNEEFEAHIAKIKDIKEQPEVTFNNPREKTWLENWLDKIVKAFTRGNYRYASKNILDAEQDTNKVNETCGAYRKSLGTLKDLPDNEANEPLDEPNPISPQSL